MNNIINYGKQTIDDDDIAELVKTLRSDSLTCGATVSSFEQAFAKQVNSRYAVSVSSGTAALHLACLSLIRPGDEIIVTPFSFIATANAILYCGGKPVFADIDKCGNLCPEKLQAKINKHTKGIIPVHYAGYPCEMSEIKTIAEKYNLWIIEDSCHALEATYKETKIGDCNYSDMNCFSFHPVKHITTGEGGMITTNKSELFHKLCLLKNHGIEREPQNFYTIINEPWYREMQFLGFNYRLTDIQCALGLSQLKKSSSFLQKRNEIAQKYNLSFKNLKKIQPLPINYKTDRHCSWHLYVLRIINHRERDNFIAYMKSANIFCQVHYMPIYMNPFYRQNGFSDTSCPQAESLFRKVASIPIFPDLTETEQNKIIEFVTKFDQKSQS